MSKWRLDPGQIEVMDDAMADLLRAKTPAQCVQMMGAAHRAARGMIEASVRREHPGWDDAAVAREATGRLARGTT